MLFFVLSHLKNRQYFKAGMKIPPFFLFLRPIKLGLSRHAQTIFHPSTFGFGLAFTSGLPAYPHGQYPD